jgi:glucuronate isomerase
MPHELRQAIFEQLDAWELVDPHTHIDPHAPASVTLADVLGYHYYTELAHSAGLARERIERPGAAPRDQVALLVEHLAPLDNTVQYAWLMEMLRELFDFQDERLTSDNWEGVYDHAQRKMAAPDWASQVLRRSKLRAVFLTNQFDDPLTGFDARVYVPCLRTDDLVFHLGKPEVHQRLERAAAMPVTDAVSLRTAIGHLFHHFAAHGARACAISLPPDFAPQRVGAASADVALQNVLLKGTAADAARRRELASYVFWTLAEMCDEFRLPFDLMIGVNRAVYTSGVYQGQDLFDSRVSLVQYREVFNAFPRVTFPISVLASVTNQELVSFAWIFPNVVTHGHWWYSNTPAYIEHDAAARLEAVPRTKQIGYYSDMYKLEFALPKFAMYKRTLAKILAERFVRDRGWSEARAVALGHDVLCANVERVFGAV